MEFDQEKEESSIVPVLPRVTKFNCFGEERRPAIAQVLRVKDFFKRYVIKVVCKGQEHSENPNDP